jgi:hypothetical protein
MTDRNEFPKSHIVHVYGSEEPALIRENEVVDARPEPERVAVLNESWLREYTRITLTDGSRFLIYGPWPPDKH